MRKDARKTCGDTGGGPPEPAGSGAFRRGRGSAVEKNGSAFSAAPESRPCVCDRMGVDRRRYLRMLLRFNRFRRGVFDCF